MKLALNPKINLRHISVWYMIDFSYRRISQLIMSTSNFSENIFKRPPIGFFDAWNHENDFIFAWLRESTCVRDAWKRRKMCVISWNHSKTCVISWKACFSPNFSVFCVKIPIFHWLHKCVKTQKKLRDCVMRDPLGGPLLMKEGDWQQKYRIFQLKSREIWWVGFKRAFEDFIKVCSVISSWLPLPILVFSKFLRLSNEQKTTALESRLSAEPRSFIRCYLPCFLTLTATSSNCS